MRLTVVLPTFNEAENLPQLVPVLFSLPLPDLEILVVDDNSPDGTGRIADELSREFSGRLTVIHRKGKMGLGTAYTSGFKHALEYGAEAIGQMDSDFSHPPEKLLEFMSALESFDLVLGSRYIEGGSVDVNWPAWRKALSSFGNIYARTILNLPYRDVTGGFRIWRRQTLQGLPLDRLRSNGYAFQIELLNMAYRLGYTYKEVPFYFADRKWGKSKMSFRVQREAAVRVWRILYEYRDLQKL